MFDRRAPSSTEAAKVLIKHLVEVSKKLKSVVERIVIGNVTNRQINGLAQEGVEIDESWVHSMENSAVIHDLK